jgi:HBS1 N-terminus
MSSDPISSDDDIDDKHPPENYAGITPTQRAQMESGLIHVRSLLGASNSITDRDIRESLWDTYFDVEGTVEWLLEKREAGAEAAQKGKSKQKGGFDAVHSIVHFRHLGSTRSIFSLIRFLPSSDCIMCSTTLLQRLYRSSIDLHSQSETVAAPAPLSALQRLSLASQESHKTKRKLPLSSLARKIQPANTEALSPSYQTLSTSQQASLSTRPHTRINEDTSQKSPLVAPTNSNLSSLARKAIDRNSSQSESGSFTGLRTSKLTQKIKLAQSASQNKGAALAADDSVQSSLPHLPQDTTLFENPKSPPDILFSFGPASRLSSPPTTRSDIPPAIPIAASASTFASILVSAKEMSLPPGTRVLSDNKGFRPSHKHETIFTFNTPSPDDIVLAKRAGTRLAKQRAGGAL